MSESGKKQKEMRPERAPTFGLSILVLAIAVVVLVVGIVFLKLAPNVPLIVCGLVLAGYGIYLGIRWSDMMEHAFESIKSSMEAIVIVMIIGMVVGAWVACGTVPFVIYWGLKIFSPAWILPFTVVLCAIMSTLTGSSWTTAGTIGIAFLGIGVSMGVPAPIMAGAICCGAFFGDTQSPMSDGCNFATAVSGAGLYNGIKGMLCTNIPALVISTVIFTFIGLGYSGSAAGGSVDQINEILKGLSSGFNLTPAVLIPAVVLFVLLAIKLPAIPTMLAAAFTGVITCVFTQNTGIGKALGYLMDGYVGNTGVKDVDSIITRGGLSGMMGTVAIMILSMWMAGILLRTGMVPVILSRISKMVSRITPLVFLTNLLTLVFSYFAADPYLAMTLPAKALGESYDDLGMDRSVLCRSVANGVVFAPIIPWGTSGVYIAGTLGVATLSYMPYYFMGMLAPVLCILFAAVGIGNFKAKDRLEEGKTATA